MKTTTVRATKEAKQTLAELSEELNESQTLVLERALKLLKRTMKFARGRAAYAALRQDKKAWAEFKQERDAWDAAPLDEPRSD